MEYSLCLDGKGMAEREGFEPPVGFPTTVFKTAAFSRSAISPNKLSLAEGIEYTLQVGGSQVRN